MSLICRQFNTQTNCNLLLCLSLRSLVWHRRLRDRGWLRTRDLNIRGFCCIHGNAGSTQYVQDPRKRHLYYIHKLSIKVWTPLIILVDVFKYFKLMFSYGNVQSVVDRFMACVTQLRPNWPTSRGLNLRMSVSDWPHNSLGHFYPPHLCSQTDHVYPSNETSGYIYTIPGRAENWLPRRMYKHQYLPIYMITARTFMIKFTLKFPRPAFSDNLDTCTVDAGVQTSVKVWKQTFVTWMIIFLN